MTKPEQIAASVRQRLKNLTGTADFQTTLVLYALERLLYRLSRSAYQQQFVLKGALLFNIWSEHSHRATRETVVAEKFQAMVMLGMSNTRLKDFYDLWVLATDFSFDGAVLGAALTATFNRRRTQLPQNLTDVVALTPLFAADAQKQQAWKAFLRKHQLGTTELGLIEVVAKIQEFVMPVSMVASRGETFVGQWAINPPKGTLRERGGWHV